MPDQATRAPQLVEQVAARARRTPDARALEDGEHRLTYAEMIRAADALALRLAAGGVGRGSLVGLSLPRSCERIVANLAIWQAGAAVLALDPAWPIEHLVRLTVGASACLVIADNAMAGPLRGAGLACLSTGQRTDGAGMADQAPGSAADSLAYVVHTSGSSGLPKGVEISHSNFLHLIEWHRDAFMLRDQDRVSHLAGLGFDASFWEVWPALCAGATVVLANEETRISAEWLKTWLIDQRISVAFVPTLLAERLIGAAWPAETRLRVLLTGGDTLRRRPVRGLPFLLVNNYGPSECTIVATSGVIDADDSGGAIDIGRPIARMGLVLLGPDGEPVADGDVGEIAISGAGVGRGYRGQTGLTDQRFRNHPTGRSPDQRRYLTGDAGRRLADGRIVFLGRLDEQEKIRGVRIEPNEVAGALAAHPDVAWTTVLGDGPAGERRLVAYVLPVHAATPTADALRRFLRTQLPEVAIPAEFRAIDTVPLSANGKVDRAALARPGFGRPLPTPEARAPADPVEARIAAIVARLLSLPSVGADDNFFLLGGQSLLAAQVILHVHEAFGVRLSLRELFRTQTVAAIASQVNERLVEAVLAMTDDEARSWVRT